MKAFLFVFDNSFITREQVWRRLNKLPEIGQWYSLFGNTFCLASEQSAQSLAARLRDEVIPEVRFLIVEVDPIRKGGWLPREIWDFLNEPPAAKEHEKSLGQLESIFDHPSSSQNGPEKRLNSL